MFTKFAVITTAAAILLTTASAAFAAPRDKQVPQRIPEPIYFQLATGEQG